MRHQGPTSRWVGAAYGLRSPDFLAAAILSQITNAEGVLALTVPPSSRSHPNPTEVSVVESHYLSLPSPPGRPPVKVSGSCESTVMRWSETWASYGPLTRFRQQIRNRSEFLLKAARSDACKAPLVCVEHVMRRTAGPAGLPSSDEEASASTGHVRSWRATLQLDAGVGVIRPFLWSAAAQVWPPLHSCLTAKSPTTTDLS